MQHSLELDDTDPELRRVAAVDDARVDAALERRSGGRATSAGGAHGQTVDAGDEASLHFCWPTSETETLAGDVRTALQHAEAADAIAMSMGQDSIWAAVLYARALAVAHLGKADEARRLALEGLTLLHATGAVLTMLLNQTMLGSLELSLDRPSMAHEWLVWLLRWVDVSASATLASWLRARHG